MHISFAHLVHVAAAYLIASGLLTWVSIGAATVIVLEVLRRRPKDIASVESGLKLVRELLGSKLGPKGDAVFAIWLQGLETVKDGKLTNAELVEEFMKFVQLAAAKKDISLNSTEINDLRSVAAHSLALTNTTSSGAAVKAMMVKL